MARQRVETVPTGVAMIFSRDYPEINPSYTGEKDNQISSRDVQRLNWWNKLILIDQDPEIRMMELTGWLEIHPKQASMIGERSGQIRSVKDLRALVIPALEQVNRRSTSLASTAFFIFEDARMVYRRGQKIRPTPLDGMARALLPLITESAPFLEKDVSLYDDRFFALGDDDEEDTQPDQVEQADD